MFPMMGGWNSFGMMDVGWGALGWTGFVALVAWSLVWKGMALWKSARKGEKGWFVALLVINTVGILEILYLFVISDKAEASKEK